MRLAVLVDFPIRYLRFSRISIWNFESVGPSHSSPLENHDSSPRMVGANGRRVDRDLSARGTFMQLPLSLR